MKLWNYEYRKIWFIDLNSGMLTLTLISWSEKHTNIDWLHVGHGVRFTKTYMYIRNAWFYFSGWNAVDQHRATKTIPREEEKNPQCRQSESLRKTKYMYCIPVSKLTQTETRTSHRSVRGQERIFRSNKNKKEEINEDVTTKTTNVGSQRKITKKRVMHMALDSIEGNAQNSHLRPKAENRSDIIRNVKG